MEEKKTKKSNLHTQTDDIVKSLENVFKGLPHLPQNVHEVLVKIAPYISLIFGILGLFAGLGAMGLSPLALLGGINASAMVFLTGLMTIASSVLMLLAYPKLVKRQYQGWVYIFWSEALNVVYAVLTLSAGSVIGILIGLYILFEVKQYYK